MRLFGLLHRSHHFSKLQQFMAPDGCCRLACSTSIPPEAGTLETFFPAMAHELPLWSVTVCNVVMTELCRKYHVNPQIQSKLAKGRLDSEVSLPHGRSHCAGHEVCNPRVVRQKPFSFVWRKQGWKERCEVQRWPPDARSGKVLPCGRLFPGGV